MKAAAIALALLGLSLGACKTVKDIPVQTVGLELPTVSEGSLTCPVEPPVPTPTNGDAKIRESKLKAYILDLRAAGRECRDKLEIARRTWRATEAKQREVSRAVQPAD